MNTLIQLGRSVVAAGMFWLLAVGAIAGIEVLLEFLGWKHLAMDLAVQAQIWMYAAVPIGLISYFHQRRVAGKRNA